MALKTKPSSKWLWVLLGVFGVNLALLLLSRFILGSQLVTANYVAFAGLSAVVALVSGVGALGMMAFFSCFILFNGFALIYMYFIVLTKRGDTWTDLTSLISFFMVLILGFVIGVLLELLSRFLGKKRGTS